MEQEQEAPTVVPTEDQEEQVQPTKSVKNFWERLDEVFTQNTELRQRMQELVEQFPTEEKPSGPYRSFIFQPDRVSICSNDDIIRTGNSLAPPDTATADCGHQPAERFYQFRIRMKRPLRNVRSIQLLSAVIPNIIQNIPDENTFFLYYKLRSVALSFQGNWDVNAIYGAGDIVEYNTIVYACINEQSVAEQPDLFINTTWVVITPPNDLTRPNYFDLHYSKIRYLYLTPTFHWIYDQAPAQDLNLFNRTFESPADLVNALNYIASQAQVNSGDWVGDSIQNDVSFVYNESINKVIFVPNPNEININQNYYMPCGYEDPNVKRFFESALVNGLPTPGGPILEVPSTWQNPANYSTLNYKLGFTWNGVFQNPVTNFSPDPWSDQTFIGSLFWYLRNQDPGIPVDFIILQQQVTFNSYPDLVNTSCLRLYCDFSFGSTQDSLGSSSSETPTADGLLSIVPVNTINQGVGFYQNNFNNPLSKIPQNITEVGITMLNDQGLPFYLPNSATVLLELGITYQ